MKCYYRCLLVRRSLWPVPGLRVGVRGAGVLTLSDCQDIARSPRGSRGQGLRHISSALLGWPVSQFRGKSKKAGQVSPGADNGDTITIRQRRAPPGRMSPGGMKLSRRDWRSEIISRFCHKWEILRGSRAGRGTRHRHQGQNPNINGLPKCALIRQLSWHKECAHAHNSNVPLLPCQLAFSWWSNRAGSSRQQQASGQYQGQGGRSRILTKGSRLNLHKCA